MDLPHGMRRTPLSIVAGSVRACRRKLANVTLEACPFQHCCSGCMGFRIHVSQIFAVGHQQRELGVRDRPM